MKINEINRGLLKFCGVLVCLLDSQMVQAQIYKCHSRGGGVTYTSQPCMSEQSSRSQGDEVVMPIKNAPVSGGEGHAKYLSPMCATLYDGIKMANARRTKYSDLRSLQDEYRYKCDEEDRQARMRKNQDDLEVHGKSLGAIDIVNKAKQQEKLNKQQCEEMFNLVQLRRRKESQFNKKEVQALRELEASYDARCLSRGG